MSLIKRFKDFFSIETPEEISSKQNDIRRRRVNREAAQDLRNKKDVIRKQLLNYSITQFIINDDLTVDVSGDVWLDAKNFYRIPFNFNKVHGNFRCSHNDLRTLAGIPKWIGGGLALNNNKLEELDYFPEYVNGPINLQDNKISHLDLHLEGNYRILLRNNPITWLNNELRIIDIDLSETPIGELLSELFRRGLPKMSTKELLERLEEFDVIKNNNEIDMISLRSLFYFFNVDYPEAMSTDIYRIGRSGNGEYKMI